MKRNERQYLQALQSFSKHARNYWQITAIDDFRIDAKFTGDPSIYRYWDATPCATFGLKMAKESLNLDLRNESAFLMKFDKAYKAVNDELDMNNNNLTFAVRFCLAPDEGALSSNKRKKLIAKGHPDVLIRRIEKIVQATLNADASDVDGNQLHPPSR